MKSARSALLSLAAVALIALVAIASCSKSSNPYTPPGGGGGGTPELSSGNIPNGGVFQHTFSTAGSFPYHCLIHGTGMAGSVTVSASSTNDSMLVTIGPGNGYTPASATIKPAGHVRWFNTGVTHTVTSN